MTKNENEGKEQDMNVHNHNEQQQRLTAVVNQTTMAEGNSNSLQMIRNNCDVIKTTPLDSMQKQQICNLRQDQHPTTTAAIVDPMNNILTTVIQHSSTINNGRQPAVSNSNISNVSEKLIQNDKVYSNYIRQQQHQQEQIPDLDELLKTCDQLMANDAMSNDTTTTNTTMATNGKVKMQSSAKNKALMKKQQQNACTLSSVNLLRTLQRAENSANGDSNFIMVPLAEQTKYQDQWMKQPSDSLTLEQRECLNILLRKSTKTKMKQQAKLFCRTNQPI